MTNFKKNDLIEAQVIDLTHEGQGVVKIDNYPFFVDNALTGEKIIMRVLKTTKNYGFGRVEQMLEKSPFRVDSLQADYLRTGIADLGHLTYEEQIKVKQKQVVDVLRKNAGKADYPVLPTVASEATSKYRNKAQVPVQEMNGLLTTGFYRKHSHILVPMENFFIQNEEIDQLVKFTRDLLRKLGLEAYSEKTRRGLLRNIVVRRGYNSGEIMLVLVVTADKVPTEIVASLLEAFPNLKSIQLSINNDPGSFILGKTFKILYGENYITDQMNGLDFQISAPAFYQVNTPQAEKLYQLAYDFAELKPTDTVIDAYSGIGTIGLGMANKVAKIYGMEVIPQAVENAKVNAKLNKIENAHYEVGTAEEIMPKWLKQGIKPDVIFVDPPRKGLDETFIKAAVATKPRSIVYISCNPATFARDVVKFEEGGYMLGKVQPVDLFPQTHHVETVALLTRKK